METLEDKIMPKLCLKFSCVYCDYYTSKKSSYINHTNSIKHYMITNGLQIAQNRDKNMLNVPKMFICSCGKKYLHRQGLWKHKKTCINIIQQPLNTIIDNALDNNEFADKEILFKSLREILKQNTELIKENSEFKQLMIEQHKHLVVLANSAGHHNTTNNNTFNLQVFLNETCKNAMNIMDFVSQLQVGIKELENTGRLGFVEGISKIFINGLKEININDRPIHCSDSKREVVYIKDNDQWNKDTEDKPLLTNAIKQVARKNIKQISEWTKDHPEYNDSASKQNDKYLKIVSEAMSGSSIEESNKNYNKIIKNIVKETIIDK